MADMIRLNKVGKSNTEDLAKRIDCLNFALTLLLTELMRTKDKTGVDQKVVKLINRVLTGGAQHGD